MTTLLTIGASRGIGLETVKAALSAGHRVKAFSRHASALDLREDNAEMIDGDATNADDVAHALVGVDCVIQSLGVAPSADVVLNGTDLFSTATRILIDVMEEKGIKRLIAVTGIGAGDSRGRGGLLYDALMFPLILKRIYDDKDVQEQMIKASSLDWTIVRPGLLRDGARTGCYRVLNDPKDWHAGPIRRSDVADFLIHEAVSGEYVHKTPVIIE